MTQRMTPILISTLAVIALALAALAGALFAARPAEAQVVTPNNRQITVIGTGDASGRPDTATVQIGVETRGATAREALDQNNTQASAVQARLAELGIAADDIQTSGFSIYTEQADSSQPGRVTGYVVQNTVGVTIRNIAQAGDLLDEVVNAGANNVYGISFQIEDQSALMEQARTNAVADARARAEQYAKAIGASVGDVLLISENTTSQPVPVMARAEAADSSVPVQPGQQQLSTSVQVTFALR